MPEKHSFLLRLPPELWEELKRWADADLRSVNAQIEYLLRTAVRRRRGESNAEAQPASPRNAPEADG
jgi:hypothetical protein